MVDNIRMEYPISVNRSCTLIHLQKSVYYYQSKGRGDELLRMRMKELAAIRVRRIVPLEIYPQISILTKRSIAQIFQY
jgi:protoheme ferro-lyase